MTLPIAPQHSTLDPEPPPMPSSQAQLPPFSSLLKSRDVEDPVNLWLHRPLAYGFVAATFRTPITPNQITVLAMLVGMVAGAMWLHGTPTAMVVGGILLWTSAILDGADGIMARAKSMHSDFGRALDGTADAVVAVFTVFPGFAHLWLVEQNPMHMVLAVPAIFSAVLHLWFYDYYKESYLAIVNGRSDGNEVEAVKEMAENAKKEGRSLIERFAVSQMMLPMMLNQQRLTRLTNPGAKTVRAMPASPEMIERFRQNNAAVMKGWSIISLAPHSYLLAICGMLDRFDLYLWIRLVFMNVVFVALLFWQRRATQKTLREWSVAADSQSV